MCCDIRFHVCGWSEPFNISVSIIRLFAIEYRPIYIATLLNTKPYENMRTGTLTLVGVKCIGA